MVATTFAADTPLVVTGFVANQGIAGNWIWWSFLLSGMMTVFFFARLWRRAEVITDVELVELRYAGKPAAFLRGFRALYFGLLMNCLIVGWVNLAMEKIVTTVIPPPQWFRNFDQSVDLASGLTALTHAPVDTAKAWALLVIFAVIALTSFYTFISGLRRTLPGGSKTDQAVTTLSSSRYARGLRERCVHAVSLISGVCPASRVRVSVMACPSAVVPRRVVA